MKDDKNMEFRCSKEQYFDFKFSLCNPGNISFNYKFLKCVGKTYCYITGLQIFDLGAGRHQYPFTFVLPTQIPPSFEGTFGHVRYALRCVAQRPWLKRDYACQTSLNVGSIVDLNTLPEARVCNSKIRTKFRRN